MKKKCEGDAGGLPASEYNGTEELPDWLEGRKAMGRCPEEENNCTRDGQKAKDNTESSYSLGCGRVNINTIFEEI